MFDLDDRIILVTGGSRGIGRAIAIELARAGASIVVGFRTDRESAGETVTQVRDLGRDAIAVSADVRRGDDVDRLVTEAHRWSGRLHGVVTSAGIYQGEPTDEVTEDQWNEVLETDLGGTFRVIQAAVPYLALEPGAAVVTVSSVLGRSPSVGGAPYQAAKAGVEQLTRALALELAPRIRVNCVAPGFVRTEMNRAGWEDPSFAAQVATATPLGRWGEPEDVAPTVRFLLSRESAQVRGAVVPVDGGLHLE